jgi:hypothetical protein
VAKLPSEKRANESGARQQKKPTTLSAHKS